MKWDWKAIMRNIIKFKYQISTDESLRKEFVVRIEDGTFYWMWKSWIITCAYTATFWKICCFSFILPVGCLHARHWAINIYPEKWCIKWKGHVFCIWSHILLLQIFKDDHAYGKAQRHLQISGNLGNPTRFNRPLHHSTIRLQDCQLPEKEWRQLLPWLMVRQC